MPSVVHAYIESRVLSRINYARDFGFVFTRQLVELSMRSFCIKNYRHEDEESIIVFSMVSEETRDIREKAFLFRPTEDHEYHHRVHTSGCFEPLARFPSG